MDPVFVVYRKNPRKKPFRVATFNNIREAEQFCETRPKTYVVIVTAPTKIDLSLLR